MVAEQEWEMRGNQVLDPRAASLDNDHMITANSGIFDQQPRIRTQTDAEATAESLMYPTSADSSARGWSGVCEQLIESRDIRSCSPVSFRPSLVPAVTAATDLGSPLSTHVADTALSEIMPAEPSYETRVPGSLGLLTHVARLGQARWKDYEPALLKDWTSEQDEQLLHVRDTAQLTWKKIVSYFPGITLNAVKGRYKHLNRSKMTFKTLANVTHEPVQMRKRSSYLTTSTPRRAVKKCRASSRIESRHSTSWTRDQTGQTHKIRGVPCGGN